MPSSNYLRGKVLDHAIRGVAFASPTHVYASLHTGDPTAGAIAGTEVSGVWYARKELTFSAQSTAGQTSNSNTVTFDPVSSGPVTATHFAIWDSTSLGNMLFYGSLAASKTFANTDVPSWLPGQMAVTAV